MPQWVCPSPDIPQISRSDFPRTDERGYVDRVTNQNDSEPPPASSSFVVGARPSARTAFGRVSVSLNPPAPLDPASSEPISTTDRRRVGIAVVGLGGAV